MIKRLNHIESISLVYHLLVFPRMKLINSLLLFKSAIFATFSVLRLNLAGRA